MRLAFLKTSLLITFAAVGAFSAAAQTNGLTPKGPERFAGEILTFEGNVNRSLFRGIAIAELTFTTSLVPGTDDVVIRAEAVSKGTLLKLFRYSFLQQYSSTVDGPTFRILKTGKHDVQKQRVRDSEALFDYNSKRVTYIETDPQDPMRPPRRIASEIGPQMYDMISAIYATRALPLEVGKKYNFPVSDSGLVYTVPIVVTGREMQRSILGKTMCFRVEPEIFGPNRLIEQKGQLVVWITDDERRIPVRAQVHTSYGRVDIKLKSSIQQR